MVALAAAADLYVYGGDRAWRWGGAAPVWLVPACTAVVLSTLLLRWRHPVAVFAVQWTYALAGLVLPGYAPFAGLLVALHATACRVPRALSLAVLASCAVPFVIHNTNAAFARGGDVGRVVLTLTLTWMILTAAVWAVGRRSYTAERRAALVLQAQEQQAAEAVRAERLRLARDLHDIVTYAVTAMMLQAAGGRALVGRDDDRVRRALGSIETAGGQALTELHRLLGLLRSVDPAAAAADVTAQPGLRDVPTLVAQARETGVDVQMSVEGEPAELDRSVDLAAYRVVQEALANAVRHGGPHARIRLHQAWGGDRVTLTARSTSGPGRVPVPSSGLGLRGLGERVALVGGRLDAEADADSEDGGFVLRAELPRRVVRGEVGHGGEAGDIRKDAV